MRRGRPSIARTVGRTALIAGTAQRTANAVDRREQERAAAMAPVPAVPQFETVPPAEPAGDLVAQLSELARLVEVGALSKKEFQAAKNKLLR